MMENRVTGWLDLPAECGAEHITYVRNVVCCLRSWNTCDDEVTEGAGEQHEHPYE